MARQRAPLLSLKASGKVGGRRRGRSRRIPIAGPTTFIAARDTYVLSGAPSVNNGDSNFLRIDKTADGDPKPNFIRSLLMFDLTPAGPITVQSALLTLNFEVVSLAFATLLTRLTRASTWTQLGATWDDFAASSPWTTPGGDLDPTTPPETSWTLPTSTGLFTLPDITPHAQDAIDNRAGLLSFCLLLTPESGPDVIETDIFSVESGDPQPPTLVITPTP